MKCVFFPLFCWHSHTLTLTKIDQKRKIVASEYVRWRLKYKRQQFIVHINALICPRIISMNIATKRFFFLNSIKPHTHDARVGFCFQNDREKCTLKNVCKLKRVSVLTQSHSEQNKLKFFCLFVSNLVASSALTIDLKSVNFVCKCVHSVYFTRLQNDFCIGPVTNSMM